ncbi:iron ABC transporter permease [Prescottella agglutinans]|uniref:Iron complex transport system permease protein n=1 Tax=Prescottella agglutinans TaxID=1644129 RepID=A0ABT6MCM3_9NOCA|nr:iron ABC transporter permease [Prescottella agglutinans]MDH6282060.1 iron complex transport system permease protein [Prescottella agglutinans]
MTTLLTRPPAPDTGAAGGRDAAPTPRVLSRRAVLVLVGLAVATVVLFLLALIVGPVRVPLADTIRVVLGAEPSDPRWQVVVHELRLPRAITAVLVGAALGVAGLQMQTLFRNALADPYVLGASSGASLGVALVVITAGAAGSASFTAGLAGMGRAGVVLAAAGGAAIVLMLVLMLSRWVRSSVTLLLVGVMVGSATTAIVSVLLVYADPVRAQLFLLWGLGSFASTTWSDLALMAPVVLVAVAVALATVRPLNALLLGEGYARTMGIDVRRTRLITLLAASVLAGVTTAFCGPIGFLGLAVPHLARLAVGTSDHRTLMPTVMLMGSAVALTCGIVSQVPNSDRVLPLNAVTAMIGAPIVITVLIRARRGVDGAAL